MIKSINLKNVATYNDTGIQITDCKKVNFIYGANGSGKTTISNFFLDPENHQYDSCSFQWENDLPMQVLIYNKKFREKNFGTSNIAGVFTLGEASDEEIKEIERMRLGLEELRNRLRKNNQELQKLKDSKLQKSDNFRDIVWTDILKKDEKIFREAFTGCLNKKQTFMDKLLEEYNRCASQTETRIELVQKARIIFGDPPIDLQLIPPLDGDTLLDIERNPIWERKIIGNQDVDIAKLIKELDISDWVNEGRKYLRDDDICPFCQSETIIDGFKEKLNKFFSGEYDLYLRKLKELKEDYNHLEDTLTNKMGNIVDKEVNNKHSLLDLNTFSDSLNVIKNIISGNKQLINTKIKEPSRNISLVSTEEQIHKITLLIKKANEEIEKNNKLFDNYKNEKENLINKIWSLIIDENKALIEKYIKEDKGLQRGIDNVKGRKESLESEIKVLFQKIIKANENLTSVQPAVDEINRILSLYGFNGFRIVPSSEENFYQIKRANGAIATETLSEGEITFITFLYFIQLSKGGSSAEKINENRVLIVDDPISSLDSNVLFIVSSLLKGIITSIKSNTGIIKQIFVLTHNVYFHKEASFIDGRARENPETNYWILRKYGNISEIQSYETKNPISSSYELMWQELKDRRNVSGITVQNIMRRIIENYFKILGKYGDDDLIHKFSNPQEQEICRSLLCWVNDGSHCIPDDLFVDSHSDITERYFTVFEQVFVKTSHEAHYKMMMGVEVS